MHPKRLMLAPVVALCWFSSLLTVSPCLAVSGIGVAAVNMNNTGGVVRLYRVTDTHVDTSYNLLTNWPIFGNTAFPVALNTHGTHLAYIRWSGNMTNNECWVGILRLSDPTKKAEIAWFGNDTGNAWGSKQICWPQGDWIYFSTANKSKYIYRVNARTRAIEFVAYLNPKNQGGSEFKMSTVNNRIGLHGGYYFTLQELQSLSDGLLNESQWPAGTFTIQGCGHTISASGNVMGNQVDPGHYVRIITPLDWTTRKIGASALYRPPERNRMSVDRADPALACSLKTDPFGGPEGFVETVGVGQATMGNNFSVNSDKWECTLSGWYPDGREQGSGGNFILWNPTDSIALNVTRLPRKLTTEQRATMTGTCLSDPNAIYFAGAPAFLVTAPVDDILPELRADATSNYTVPGVDDNTQFPALTKLPKTPDGGWPISPITAAGPGPRSAVVSLGGPIAVTVAPACIRIRFRGNAPHWVTVLDARGMRVASRGGAGAEETFTSRDGLGAGIYLLRTRGEGWTATTRVTVLGR